MNKIENFKSFQQDAIISFIFIYFLNFYRNQKIKQSFNIISQAIKELLSN